MKYRFCVLIDSCGFMQKFPVSSGFAPSSLCKFFVINVQDMQGVFLQNC